MLEFKALSGAKVIINEATWQKAMALKNAISKELSEVGIDIDMSTLQAENKSDALNGLIEPLLKVDSSPEVYKALFECLEYCNYDGEKITEDTFEDLGARQDYYQIMIECIKVNLSPFFKGLLSKFATLM